MMTPPPNSVRSEPLPFEEEACERAACSTIAGTGAPESDERRTVGERRVAY